MATSNVQQMSTLQETPKNDLPTDQLTNEYVAKRLYELFLESDEFNIDVLGDKYGCLFWNKTMSADVNLELDYPRDVVEFKKYKKGMNHKFSLHHGSHCSVKFIHRVDDVLDNKKFLIIESEYIKRDEGWKVILFYLNNYNMYPNEVNSDTVKLYNKYRPNGRCGVTTYDPTRDDTIRYMKILTSPELYQSKLKGKGLCWRDHHQVFCHAGLANFGVTTRLRNMVVLSIDHSSALFDNADDVQDGNIKCVKIDHFVQLEDSDFKKNDTRLISIREAYNVIHYLLNKNTPTCTDGESICMFDMYDFSQ